LLTFSEAFFVKFHFLRLNQSHVRGMVDATTFFAIAWLGVGGFLAGLLLV